MKSKLLQRIPLNIKMTLLSVMVGLIVWAILDHAQTLRFKNIFIDQLSKRLSQRALEDRTSFDRYVKSHYQSVKLFVSQKRFSDYIEKQRWSAIDNIQIKHHSRPPVWFPRLSVLRAFVQPRYALLIDAQGRVREVYKSRRDAPPSSLLQPTPLLLAKSTGQNFMTNLEGIPYLVASKSIMSPQGKLKATLMLACPIDDEFLVASLGPFNPGHIVALLTSGEEPQILTSSNLVELPAGTPLSTLRDSYLVTGQEFFDYGAAEQAIKFVSFISKAEVEMLTKSMISRERQERSLAALAFIFTFALVIFAITRRVQQLNKRISDFSQYILGVRLKELPKGDQLYALEERFQRLTEDVLAARDILKREAQKRFLLEKKNMEIKQKDKQLKLLQSVTEAMGVGLAKKTPDGLQAVNQQMDYFAKCCGGLSFFDIDIEDDGSLEIPLRDSNGDKRVFHINSPSIFEEKMLLIRDITEVKAQTEALKHLAMHDVLTDLPNRALFYDRLRQAVLVAQREDEPLAVIVIDLDHFKEVNDTMGHPVGDMLLKQVGVRLPSMIRKSDTVARLGGDEFAVLLPTADTEHAKRTACNLLNVLEQPFVIEGKRLYISASFGIAIYPDHADDADDLFRVADMTMYDAKQARCGLSIYDPIHAQSNVSHFTLRGELRQAIENEELVIYYQPKVSFKTRRVDGVEALIRWQHPQRDLIYPDEFIPLAEHTGVINSLLKWILGEVLRQYAEWQRAGIQMSVSVNLSAWNLQDSKFFNMVVEELKKWDVDPRYLELEITESAIMSDPGNAMKILTRLHDIGIQLSVDDFGTGYSSLAYLKKLAVDEIKIDKSFIKHMAVNENDAVIIRSTIDLGHNLGLTVCAEGVEQQEVWFLLNRLGCDSAQGYHISPPLPAAELTRWLNESPWWVKKEKVLQL